MKARVFPIVKPIWLLPFMYLYFWHFINTTSYHWAKMSLHLSLAVTLPTPSLGALKYNRLWPCFKLLCWFKKQKIVFLKKKCCRACGMMQVVSRFIKRASIFFQQKTFFGIFPFLSQQWTLDKWLKRPLYVLFLLDCNTCDVSSFAAQISKQMV